MILAAPREVNSGKCADPPEHGSSIAGATRCEVRYCLPGIGVGVEFIGISPESVRKIEREVQLC